MSTINKSSQPTIFKCHQHANIISKKFQSFYEKGEFFDTTLMAGSNGSSIKVHKVVLCALSEYFLEIFRCNQPDVLENTVELKEIEHSTLKLIIDFMYSGTLELSLETVGQLLKTSSFLKITPLIDGCCDFIAKNIDFCNFMSWFRIANELSLSSLKVEVMELFSSHFKETLEDEDFLKLSEHELKELMFYENRQLDCEEKVFLAKAAWINYDQERRDHMVCRLLQMIRYQNLTPEFIVENMKSVCRFVDSYKLICSWLQWHMLPKVQSNNQQSCTTITKQKRPAVIRCFSDGEIKIETFDPNINLWSITIETQLPKPRNQCFLSLVVGGKLIVTGREEERPRMFDIFDLYTCQWTTLTLPPIERRQRIWRMANLNGHLCTLRQEVGKSIEDIKILLEIYNFSTGKWRKIQIPTQSDGCVRIATHNEMVYLLDLEDGYIQTYNFSSNQWTLRKIKKERLYHFGFAAIDGFLYIFGGFVMPNTLDEWSKNVRRYNLSNDSWSDMMPMPYERGILDVKVSGNTILISDMTNIDEYNYEKDTWKVLRPIEKTTDECKWGWGLSYHLTVID